MAAVTLATLRARVAARADVTIDAAARVTPTIVNQYINEAIEGYQLVLTDAGHPQREKRDQLSTTATRTVTNGWPANEFVELPADFLQLREVSIDDGAGYRSPLRPFTGTEIGALSADYPFTLDQVVDIPQAYRVSEGDDGAKILRLLPGADAVYTVTVVYAPTVTQLSGDSDSFDFFPGTVEYVVCEAALKVMADTGIPDQGSAQLIAQTSRAAEERLMRFAHKLNRAGPQKMVDTRRLRKVGRWLRWP